MATSAYLYPYDTSGALASNKIVSENHTVQPPNNISDASFIIPRAAPFFGESIIIRTGPTAASTTLTEGVDYYLTHKFVTLSYVLSRPIYGSITFINRNYTGDVFVTYQTVGGEYVLDSYSIIEERTRSLYSVFMVTWEQVSGSFPQLPPYDHKMAGDDVTGFGAVVDSVNNLSAVIAASGSGSSGSGTGTGDGGFAALQAHVNANTSHTKSQVGLGNVDNYKTANEADVVAASTRTFMTPAMTKYYFENTVFVTQLQTARQDITELKTRANTNETNITQNRDAINLINQSLTQLATNQDTIREDIDNLIADVATALDPFDNLPSTVDRLTTEVTALATRATALETVNTSQQNAINALTDRVKALEDAKLIAPVLARLYGKSEILKGQIIKIPAKRKALLTVLGSIDKSAVAKKGYVYSIADANGVIRSIEDLSIFAPLITVNGITTTTVYNEAVTANVAEASSEFYFRGNLASGIITISINGGEAVDLDEVNLDGFSYSAMPSNPGAMFNISYTGAGQIKVVLNVPSVLSPGLYVNPSLSVDDTKQSNQSWKLYNSSGTLINPALAANQQRPPEFGTDGSNGEYGIKFSKVEVTLGTPMVVTDADIIGYTYVAGSVSVKSGVTFTDKTKTAGVVPNPVTANPGDAIARLPDVTINTVNYPVSFDTVYTTTTTKGVPSTGYGQLAIDNSAGTVDIYLLLSGDLSLVAVADNTTTPENLITVTFPS